MRILIFTTSFLNKVGKFTSLFVYLDRSLTASYISKTIGIAPRVSSQVVV
jgi:hypothetical protein